MDGLLERKKALTNSGGTWKDCGGFITTRGILLPLYQRKKEPNTYDEYYKAGYFCALMDANGHDQVLYSGTTVIHIIVIWARRNGDATGES
jgi:hypothetical protein